MFQATEDHWKETNAKMSTLVSRYIAFLSVYKLCLMNFFLLFLPRDHGITFVVSVKSKDHAFLVPCETSRSISIHFIHISSINGQLIDHYLLAMCVTDAAKKVN
jgi:hypothetical protein